MLRERKVRRGGGDTARSSSDSSRQFEIKAEGEAWLESHNLPAAMPSSCDIVFVFTPLPAVDCNVPPAVGIKSLGALAQWRGKRLSAAQQWVKQKRTNMRAGFENQEPVSSSCVFFFCSFIFFSHFLFGCVRSKHSQRRTRTSVKGQRAIKAPDL